MLGLILGTGIPVTYFATWIMVARFLFRKWRTDGDWDLNERDNGVVTFLASGAGLFWPIVVFVVAMAVAVTAKQPPTAVEERELRRKAERRLAEAEAELKQATLAANNTSDHHREVTRD